MELQRNGEFWPIVENLLEATVLGGRTTIKLPEWCNSALAKRNDAVISQQNLSNLHGHYFRPIKRHVPQIQW